MAEFRKEQKICFKKEGDSIKCFQIDYGELHDIDKDLEYPVQQIINKSCAIKTMKEGEEVKLTLYFYDCFESAQLDWIFSLEDMYVRYNNGFHDHKVVVYY